MPEESVSVFIDYENIRISLKQNFVERVDIPVLVQAVRDVVARIGELRAIRVYADWTRRERDARQFQEAGCMIVQALRKRSGQDRTDMKMAFEVDDATRGQADISACLIVSGDAHFSEAILRGTERGKKMHLSAVSVTTARELLGQVQGFYPLDTILKLSPIQAPKPLLEVAQPEEDLVRFVRRLHGLEVRLPYVVRNYLRDTIMRDSVIWGETTEERDAFIDRAISQEIVEEHRIPNPVISGRNVVCIRLIKDNLIVRTILT